MNKTIQILLTSIIIIAISLLPSVALAGTANTLFVEDGTQNPVPNILLAKDNKPFSPVSAPKNETETSKKVLTPAQIQEQYLKEILIQTSSHRMDDIEREIFIRSWIGFPLLIGGIFFSIGGVILSLSWDRDAGKLGYGIGTGLGGIIWIIISQFILPPQELNQKENNLRKKIERWENKPISHTDGLLNISFQF